MKIIIIITTLFSLNLMAKPKGLEKQNGQEPIVRFLFESHCSNYTYSYFRKAKYNRGTYSIEELLMKSRSYPGTNIDFTMNECQFLYRNLIR